MTLKNLYLQIKKSGLKFIFWDIFWTAKFLSFKKVGNFISVSFQNTFFRCSKVYGVPYKLTVDLTAKCNLRCPLCPTGQGNKSRKKGNMTINNFESLIKEIGKYLIDIDLFNWGEPFLNEDVFEAISLCSKNKIKARISSNLNYFPDGYEEELVKSKLHHLVVSLDGTTQESYSKYRVGGSINKVLDAVNRISKERKRKNSQFPFLTWQFLVMDHNKMEIEKARKLYRKWGFDRIVFQRDRGDMGEELFGNNPKKMLRKTCSFLWNQSVINWDGSVSPCCLYYDEKYDFGNTFDKGFLNIWNNKKYQEARKMVLSKKPINNNLVCFYCLKNGFPD